MIQHISVLGRFGCGNLGDDTILQNEITILKHAFPTAKITVFTGNPIAIRQSAPDCATFPLPPIMWYRLYKLLNIAYTIKLLKIIRKTDVFILGGGGFFSDWQFFAVPGWLRWCRIARFFGARVISFCIGAGPFLHNYTRRIINRSSEIFDLMIVRDQSSFTSLVEAGFADKKLHKLIDPAFLTPNHHIAPKREIGFIVHDQEAYFVSQISHLLKETDFSIKFIIADIVDIEKNKKILAALSCNSRCSLVIPHSVKEFISEIGSCTFIVSERLHGCIVAYTQKVPFLNIYYHFKGAELIHLLSIEEFSVDIKNLENIALSGYIHKLHQFPWQDIDTDTYQKKLFTLLQKNNE